IESDRRHYCKPDFFNTIAQSRTAHSSHQRPSSLGLASATAEIDMNECSEVEKRVGGVQRLLLGHCRRRRVAIYIYRFQFFNRHIA
ncbi:hypothetical protein, partial [Sphingomonas sp. CFBP 13706]|uniref:hypothetical protein n=1 Tax=Sphingomonas sp. CFBP 13706 TaxID=2775314 RepID=UPI001A7E69AB